MSNRISDALFSKLSNIDYKLDIWNCDWGSFWCCAREWCLVWCIRAALQVASSI